nr:hypothetical protein Itr_chr07CG09800 [Ipomoea trifida]
MRRAMLRREWFRRSRLEEPNHLKITLCHHCLAVAAESVTVTARGRGGERGLITEKGTPPGFTASASSRSNGEGNAVHFSSSCSPTLNREGGRCFEGGRDLRRASAAVAFKGRTKVEVSSWNLLLLPMRRATLRREWFRRFVGKDDGEGATHANRSCRCYPPSTHKTLRCRSQGKKRIRPVVACRCCGARRTRHHAWVAAATLKVPAGGTQPPQDHSLPPLPRRRRRERHRYCPRQGRGTRVDNGEGDSAGLHRFCFLA